MSRTADAHDKVAVRQAELRFRLQYKLNPQR